MRWNGCRVVFRRRCWFFPDWCPDYNIGRRLCFAFLSQPLLFCFLLLLVFLLLDDVEFLLKEGIGRDSGL